MTMMMMMQQQPRRRRRCNLWMTFLAVVVVVTLASSAAAAESNNNNPLLRTNNQQEQHENNDNINHDHDHDRNLQASFDFFRPGIDKCNNNPNLDEPAILGDCDFSKFPTCQNGRSEICYNRKPSRDHFHPDTHQPVYYIQYDRVFCYPTNWGGCSSCTPGRYCQSEQRCILDEVGYPCSQWY